MSRCYPYPPPGYEKKASLPDLSVPAKKEKKNKGKDREKKSKDTLHKEKKESTGDKDREKNKDKHKERRDKDKKEKRRKDGEPNGLSHDKDLRSSKLQRSSQEAGANHSKEENGRTRENSLLGFSVATPLERDGRGAAARRSGSSTVAPTSHPPAVYIKKGQSNGKAIEAAVPSLVLSEPPGGRPPKQEAAPSIRPPSNHNHHIDSNNVGSQRPKKLPDFSISDSLLQQAPWSTVDDEEWLQPSTGRELHARPKAEVEEERSPQLVWAKAVFLSSADMYALPYVVPY